MKKLPNIPIPPRPILYGLLISMLFTFAFFISRCGGNSETKIGEGTLASESEKIPLPSQEFRAAWVATVDNIDWPSSRELSVADQKKEALAILDRIVDLNMNAVIFQVRPQADALYQSNLEPWSYYLTGEQGKAPKPLYDPLKFWIEQAHHRGLQLHAWFNPYRANHQANRGPISDQSIIKRRPELVVKLGDKGYWWMDPSQEEAKKHTIEVILDVVSRYDIDGVHFDDYFYPYPSYHNHKDFPDDTSYTIYQENGGQLSISDWRRDSVNQLIRELYPLIKEKKKHVEFGISPFGIWRPGYPEGVKGLDQHEVLYADARRWIREGWVDYLMPQLYWPLDSKHQSFSDLLLWWKKQNLKERHIWPGLNIVKAGTETNATELVDQISFSRSVNLDKSGVCVFSMKWLMRPDFAGATAVKAGPWAEPALIPDPSWIEQAQPQPPSANLIKSDTGQLLVRFVPGNEDVFQYVLNEKRGAKWLPPMIIPSRYHSYTIKDGIEAIAIRSVDRFRKVSQPVVVKIEQ